MVVIYFQIMLIDGADAITLSPLITTKGVFNLFYYKIKSLLLGMKWVFKKNFWSQVNRLKKCE